MRVYVKLRSPGTKFVKVMYYTPWLHALVDDSSKPVLVMTFHSYKQDVVLNIHNALCEGRENEVEEYI